MNSPIEDIKSRLDIVELIQSYIKVQKAGVNYKALCPFHGEKTPSFVISSQKQIWHCFGCGKGGDIFKFVMEMEGMDFSEVLRLLAQKAGVELKRENPAFRSEKNRLYEICEESALIFEKNLRRSAAVKEYLKKRGVKGETARDFRLGFAPESWDFLLRALSAKGFKKEEIEKAGLAVKSADRDSHYDRFRSRIMFPIMDTSERVTGFGGRIFENSSSEKKSADTAAAKYVNTPSTPVYDKSSVLYGFDRAKDEIRKQDKVVLVEGYMDCLMSHQAGVKNTVSVSGTALTQPQLKTLRRLCGTIICSFDTDSAGENATRRSLALASEFEFERKIAVISSGKDPADMVLENPKKWLDSVNEAKPVVEYFFEKTFREKNPNTVNGKKEISAALLPYVSEIYNEIEKSHWVSKLAEKLEVGEDSIWKELRRTKTNLSPYVSAAGYAARKPATEPVKVKSRRELLEERLLVLLPLTDPEVRTKELTENKIVFSSETSSEIFKILAADLPDINLAPELQDQLRMLRFKGEIITPIVKSADEDFIVCKKELEKLSVKEELEKVGRQIQEKEKSASPEELKILLQNFQELTSRLKEI